MESTPKLTLKQKKALLKGKSANEPNVVKEEAEVKKSGATDGGNAKGVKRKRTEEPLQREPKKTVKREEKKQKKAKTTNSAMEKRKERLDGARFRFLNEQLYTTTGAEAFESFSREPELFQAYHEGYRHQVRSWPTNPLDHCIAFVRRLNPSAVVADFGCGDAVLAQSVKHKVHSFDLVSTSPLVTACDMAHTPLPAASCDAAVFCLSLMGTNFVDFLTEAHRVIKPRGTLKVAEVISRVTDESRFLAALSLSGFTLASRDQRNSHFAAWTFTRSDQRERNLEKLRSKVAGALKPCLYKKR